MNGCNGGVIHRITASEAGYDKAFNKAFNGVMEDILLYHNN